MGFWVCKNRGPGLATVRLHFDGQKDRLIYGKEPHLQDPDVSGTGRRGGWTLRTVGEGEGEGRR